MSDDSSVKTLDPSATWYGAVRQTGLLTSASLDSDVATLAEKPEARENRATQMAVSKMSGSMRRLTRLALWRQAQPERAR